MNTDKANFVVGASSEINTAALSNFDLQNLGVKVAWNPDREYWYEIMESATPDAYVLTREEYGGLIGAALSIDMELRATKEANQRLVDALAAICEEVKRHAAIGNPASVHWASVQTARAALAAATNSDSLSGEKK